jgi:hypothetical protein
VRAAGHDRAVGFPSLIKEIIGVHILDVLKVPSNEGLRSVITPRRSVQFKWNTKRWCHALQIALASMRLALLYVEGRVKWVLFCALVAIYFFNYPLTKNDSQPSQEV